MQTVAVVQAGTVLGDTRRTIEKLEQPCSKCAERNVKLSVFPKGFISGYPKGMVFAASLGIRTEDARHLFQAYADGAIEVPGPMQLESTRSPSVLRGRGLSVSSSAMGDVVLLRAFLRTRSNTTWKA